MKDIIWENQIAINSEFNSEFDTLLTPKEYFDFDNKKIKTKYTEAEIKSFSEKDISPIPTTKDREGYFGDDHYSYWMSGLRDFSNLFDLFKKHSVNNFGNYLDIGAASGRVIRHANYLHEECNVFGADINLKHVNWMKDYLPSNLIAFQNTSIPYLPFESNTFDLISAFSVFTHVESFIEMWLLEMKRVTKPGGILYITLQTDYTLKKLTDTWPVYKSLKNHPEFSEDLRDSGMKRNKRVFRWGQSRSYSSNVFYKTDYIEKNWGRIFEIMEIKRMYPAYQDVIVLKKRNI
jgi:SAM-dependent methyltransferase